MAWKGSTESKNPFQLATSLEGHTGAVTCLAVGAKWLYSGSADSTIRVGIIMIFLSFYFTPSTDLVQKIAFIAIH